MPAVTPAAVQIFSELRTKIGSGSTVIEGNSLAIWAANAQWVVAMQPSIKPACAARNGARPKWVRSCWRRKSAVGPAIRYIAIEFIPTTVSGKAQSRDTFWGPWHPAVWRP